MNALLMSNADPLGFQKWKTAIKNYTLMPHPHFETGSQDCFLLFTCANQVCILCHIKLDILIIIMIMWWFYYMAQMLHSLLCPGCWGSWFQLTGALFS